MSESFYTPEATSAVQFGGAPRGCTPLAYGIVRRTSPSKYCSSRTVPPGGKWRFFITIGFPRSYIELFQYLGFWRSPIVSLDSVR